LPGVVDRTRLPCSEPIRVCDTDLVRTHGLRFDVNCSILFTELPLLARPAAARAAGFDAVEFWWPFEEMAPAGADADAFVAAIADAGVELVSLNFHAGDMAAGERGLVSVPAAAGAFRQNIGACVEIARRTGCRRLNAAYGNRPDGADPAEQDAVAIENLTLAAQAADAFGASVLVEAINSIDVPAFPVDSSDAAIAEPAGRGAPGTGTLDFEPLFARLAALGYSGSVGLEYLALDPSDSSTSFGWLA
jgi:hydroxypyruvate isomerase